MVVFESFNHTGYFSLSILLSTSCAFCAFKYDPDEKITINFNDEKVSFESESGIYLISRVIDGNFPDYKQILPKESKTEVTVLKNDLQSFKIDKIKAYLKDGAQVSDTVHNLFIDAGILEGKKKNVLSKKTPQKKEEAKK